MLGIYCRTSVAHNAEVELSTIDQQKMAGVKFANDNNLRYFVYEDAGKSGYKISDDDLDPFNNRPAFMDLITDIKEGKIKKVWVWEHSRLSRNNYALAFIFNIFEKHNITLYENQKEFILNDPQIKFTRQILCAVSEYERHLIVNRMTRGRNKRINEGGRVFHALFCYKRDGKNERGYTKWTPVESEIDIYKFCLNNYMNGLGIRKICAEIMRHYKMEIKALKKFMVLIGDMLRGYYYTGYQLTIEGYDIYKKFRKNELDNIQCLLDRRYWVKSINYPLELISIENWVKLTEQLQEHSVKIRTDRRLLRARSEIGTGIIECGYCGSKYYYKTQIKKSHSTGQNLIYYFYYHFGFYNGEICNQKPKTLDTQKVNEIFKNFYFFYSLVFDNEKKLMRNNHEQIKHKITELKKQIITLKNELSQTVKNMVKLQSVLNETDDVEIIKAIAKNINLIENEKANVQDELQKANQGLDILNRNLIKSEDDLNLYNVQSRIKNWFFNMNVEDQRSELIRVINRCLIFNDYLIIDAGQTIFLFDVKADYCFDVKLIDGMNKNEIYKTKVAELNINNTLENHKNCLIFKVNLQDKKNQSVVSKFISKKFGITYELDGFDNFVSFIDLADFWAKPTQAKMSENTNTAFIATKPKKIPITNKK